MNTNYNLDLNEMEKYLIKEAVKEYKNKKLEELRNGKGLITSTYDDIVLLNEKIKKI